MKKMNVYPEIVEAVYWHNATAGIIIPKNDVYENLLTDGEIDEDGNITLTGMDDGLNLILLSGVGDYKNRHTLAEYKNIDTSFKQYPDEFFYYMPAKDLWMLKPQIVWVSAQQVLDDPDSSKDMIKWALNAKHDILAGSLEDANSTFFGTPAFMFEFLEDGE